jgi:hypothetical protein
MGYPLDFSGASYGLNPRARVPFAIAAGDAAELQGKGRQALLF